jgi:hypothetical protein
MEAIAGRPVLCRAGPKSYPKKSPAHRGAGVRGEGWPIPPPWVDKLGLTRVQIRWPCLWLSFLVYSALADCRERGRRVSATFGVRVAPAHDEPRSGPNNSKRVSTSGRSTKYGSGHLIRVFRDIGRIFSLLFPFQHPSAVGHPLRLRVQKRKTQYGFVEGQNGLNSVSCGTRRAFRQNETPPERS